MLPKIICSALASGAILLAFGAAKEQDPKEHAEVERGKDLFARRCSGCHAPDLIKEGPPLRGVFGRKAGSASGFVYSEALKRAGIRWDEATLDRWLSDPDAMAPDTDMEFRLTDAAERKSVITYLKSLRNP